MKSGITENNETNMSHVVIVTYSRVFFTIVTFVRKIGLNGASIIDISEWHDAL